MAKSLRNQLVRFHKKDPNCRWCGSPTKLIPSEDLRSWPHGKAYPNDMATIDHIYSRLNQERYKKHKNTHVLACRKCNQKRATKEARRKPDVIKFKSSGPGRGLTGPEALALYQIQKGRGNA